MRLTSNCNRLPLVAVAAALVMIMAAACADNSCYDNGSSIPMARFVQSGTSNAVTVSALTVRGIDAPGDSLLVDSANVSQTYLPLRATTTVTQWELDYGSERALLDTITFAYEPIPVFVSAECGAMYQFRLTQVTATTHGLDSVTVLKPLIDNVSTPALYIHIPVE